MSAGERDRRRDLEVWRRLFAVRTRICWLERSQGGGTGERLALTIERDVLEWVLGNRDQPAIPLAEDESGPEGAAGAER
jgi:hypothetical protein